MGYIIIDINGSSDGNDILHTHTHTSFLLYAEHSYCKSGSIIRNKFINTVLMGTHNCYSGTQGLVALLNQQGKEFLIFIWAPGFVQSKIGYRKCCDVLLTTSTLK